jgi:excinuclease ABC subunit C
VAVIALAKREEEVYLPGRPAPVMLERGSAGLQLLQRIRDEAHRFAIGFHRQRRAKAAVDSIFDDLPGVGPARRKLLMKHFGTGQALTAAGREQLESVPDRRLRSGARSTPPAQDGLMMSSVARCR